MSPPVLSRVVHTDLTQASAKHAAESISLHIQMPAMRQSTIHNRVAKASNCHPPPKPTSIFRITPKWRQKMMMEVEMGEAAKAER